MPTRVFRYDRGRMLRNLTGVLPLVGFPAMLHLTGRADPVLWALFGGGAATLVVWVLYNGRRFKLVVDEELLDVRGRLRHRRIPFVDVLEMRVRRGRGKTPRFMGPPPFRELVLRTSERRVVISSLPLGEEAFDELVALLDERLSGLAPEG